MPKTASRSELAELPIDQLAVGSRIGVPIYDDRNVLLLAKGEVITERFLAHLRARFAETVWIDRAVAARFAAGHPQGTAEAVPESRPAAEVSHRNAASDRLDASVLAGKLQLPPQGPAFLDGAAPEKGGYDEGRFSSCAAACLQGVGRVGEAYESFLGGGAAAGMLGEVAERTMGEFALDVDVFAAIAANPFTGDFPARHSVHVSMLATAIGARLRLDRPTTYELAVGCLFHDVGMLRVDRGLLETPGPIDDVAFLEIAKHPIHAFDLLKGLSEIPKRSAFIAYQTHERCDGSGYPRRRQAAQIHFLSKIAAVADTYVALVSPRPYRPAVMPYYAMERMLRDARQGRYDRDAVRALLRTLSLFPIGSYVELSDGRRGRVLRAGEDYTRPVVGTTASGAGEVAVVDLAAETGVSVVRPLPALSAAAAAA